MTPETLLIAASCIAIGAAAFGYALGHTAGIQRAITVIDQMPPAALPEPTHAR